MYNPAKPSRFHIKLFEVCESESGYIVGFKVYTGKDTDQTVDGLLDPTCSKTTKLVFGMLQDLELLDKGYFLYMDNYYNSFEAAMELFCRQVYLCGTQRLNRKNLPNSVKLAKLKRGESVFRRNGPCLVLKWCDKRSVTIITTIHEAVSVITRKVDANGDRIVKPECVLDYTRNMSGVDLADQIITNYNTNRKSNKWWRTLFFHLFNMVLLNAFILNKKYGSVQLGHFEFREYIANYLIAEGLNEYTLKPQPLKSKARQKALHPERLLGRHFPAHIESHGGKRKHPARLCVACNFTDEDCTKMGYPGRKIPKKFTSYCCSDCDVALCISPCFKIYHSEKRYREQLIQLRA